MIIDNKKIKNKEILDQYLEEKLFAVKVRQNKIQNWLSNEESYNGVIKKTLLTRSNLHIPKVFEGVQMMSSRLGMLPEFDSDVKPEGDDNAKELMKGLFDHDSAKSMLDRIFDESKIEAGIYGRAVYKIVPTNKGTTFRSVDTMAFLIDPLATKTKTAAYQGEQFIYKTMAELESEADEMDYDKAELKKMKDDKSDSYSQINSDQEKSQKAIRAANVGLSNVSQYGRKVYEITEWHTKIGKERKVITVANDRYVLRVADPKSLGYTRSPYFSWASFPRAITFWVPGVADILRDGGLAIDLIMNQNIDNNTYRNFGMLFVDSASGIKQGSISPRPLGVTPVTIKPGGSISSSIFRDVPPSISESLGLMSQIGNIIESAAGLNAPNPGGKKLSVTQSAQLSAMVEEKTNTMRQNIIDCFEEMYQAYCDSIKQNLTDPRSIKVFGLKQLTIEGVTKKNFKDIEFIAKAIPKDTSQQNKAIKQKSIVSVYELFKDDPKVPGQNALRRHVAKQFIDDVNILDDIFSQEQQQQTPVSPQDNMKALMTPPIAGGAPKAAASPTPAGGAPPQDRSPMLEQTQKVAQSNVPR